MSTSLWASVRHVDTDTGASGGEPGSRLADTKDRIRFLYPRRCPRSFARREDGSSFDCRPREVNDQTGRGVRSGKPIALLVDLGNSISGAAGGAGFPRSVDSGSAL